MPSKKVLSILIITIALVGAIIITFGKDKSSQAINFANNLVAGEKLSIPENPNWQNELNTVTPYIQTDPETADSIGDNTTETVSTTLISNYLALKQTGKLDSDSAQRLIDQTVDYIEKTSPPVTDITELNIINISGKQSMFDYGENLGNIIKIKKPTDIKNELNIVMKIIQSNDQTQLNELDTSIAIYKNIVSDLTEMPVPKTFVKVHLDITNGVNGIIFALTETKNVLKDPIKGLTALQLYQKNITQLSLAVNATSAFLKQNNIVYKQGSGGYYLLYGI